MYEKSELKAYKSKISINMKYLLINQMIYWEQMYTKLLNHVDNHY